MEKKIITLEAFEQYDKKLKEYIDAHDGLVFDDESTCHMTSDDHENCGEE